MDPSIRFINVSESDKKNAADWILPAAAAQQKYYENINPCPWQRIKGKREILEMLVQDIIFEDEPKDKSASSRMERVNMMINVIYEQMFNFSDFKFSSIEPIKKLENETIKFPVFSVSSKKHNFVIDQDGIIYNGKFHFMNVHKFISFWRSCHMATLKVHDFQGLLNEVIRALYQEQEEVIAFGQPSDEKILAARTLCQKVYEILCLNSDFSVGHFYVLGKDNEKCCHYPVIKVATCNEEPGKPSLFCVDHVGRVYRNWEDFSKDNIYPKSLLCYPRQGTYQADQRGKVFLDIARSPAYGPRKIALPIFNATGAVVGLVSLGFSGPVAILALSVSAALTMGTGLSKLYDRWRHKQSLGSLEAVSSWIDVATAGLDISGGLLIAKELAAGQKLVKEADIAIKVLKFITPSLKTAQKISAVYVEIRAAKQNLRGLKITNEDVIEVFSLIKKSSIKLKNLVIQCSEKVKMFFLNLWCTNFARQENSVIAEGIETTISITEKLENHMKCCESEEDFFDRAEFVILYKANYLKYLKKMHLQNLNSIQEILPDKLVDSVSDKQCDVIGSDDRKDDFMKNINEIPVEEIKTLYDEYSKTIPTLNESDELKFHSNSCAINNFFSCCVCIENDVTPGEYFAILRRVAKDDKLIVNSEECDHGKCVTYCDSKVPVTVRVIIIGKEKFLLSLDFEDFFKSEKKIMI